jgi:hypothetical protein
MRLADSTAVAEGATGAFRDTFLLLSNPSEYMASATIEFLGAPRPTSFYSGPIPPYGRVTIPIKSLTYGPYATPAYPLADAEFAMRVIASPQPIVAERAMYWLGDPGPWADGTSVFGLTSSGLRWGFAEGRVGGPLAFHTYIRVFNPTYTKSAEVKVTYLKADGTTVVQTYTVPGSYVNVAFPPAPFVTIDANATPGLQNESFGVLVESTNGVEIVAERSMYWDAGGVFWAGGLATAGTRLP